MKTQIIAILALGVGFSMESANAQAFAYSESDFTPSSWTLFHESEGASRSSASHMPSGGNPGAYLSVTNFSADESIGAFIYFVGAAYDPATSGPIFGVSGSFDHINRAGGQGVSLALRQGGTNYCAAPDNHTYPAMWTTLSWTGLTAASFQTFTTAAQHPDFTASGLPIQFGIFNWNGAFGVRTTVSGFDNYRVFLDELRIWPAFELGYMASTGRLYQVQYTTNLPNAQWFNLGPQTIGTGTNIFLFDSTRHDAKRYYRVVITNQ